MPSASSPRQGHPSDGLAWDTREHNTTTREESTFTPAASKVKPAMDCRYTSLVPVLVPVLGGWLRVACLDSHKARLGRAAPTTARRRWDPARERLTSGSQAHDAERQLEAVPDEPEEQLKITVVTLLKKSKNNSAPRLDINNFRSNGTASRLQTAYLALSPSSCHVVGICNPS